MSHLDDCSDPVETVTPVEGARLCKNCLHAVGRLAELRCKHSKRTGFSLVTGELSCASARGQRVVTINATSFCGADGKYYEALEIPEPGAIVRTGE